VLDLDRLRLELIAACTDADVDPACVVAFVLGSRRPEGTTPLAYLNPAGSVQPDTVAVFRAVGAKRAEQYAGHAHRLAVWGELPGFPEHALGPMLRHELEHARRFERSGPRFFEVDDLLRSAVRAAGGHGYAWLPSELEANAAAAAYAARTLTQPRLAELRAVPNCASFLDGAAPPADVVEATLAALESHDPGLRDLAAEVRSACASWSPDEWRAARAREGPRMEVV
jgi:hypothetical protein